MTVLDKNSTLHFIHDKEAAVSTLNRHTLPAPRHLSAQHTTHRNPLAGWLLFLATHLHTDHPPCLTSCAAGAPSYRARCAAACSPASCMAAWLHCWPRHTYTWWRGWVVVGWLGSGWLVDLFIGWLVERWVEGWWIARQLHTQPPHSHQAHAQQPTPPDR